MQMIQRSFWTCGGLCVGETSSYRSRGLGMVIRSQIVAACASCMRLSSSRTLRLHMRRHGGRRVWNCDGCLFQFRQPHFELGHSGPYHQRPSAAIGCRDPPNCIDQQQAVDMLNKKEPLTSA
ncbi:hypothetical protein M758_UG223200, partial [Ceratodon purpureus]